jgi:putative transposase
MSGLSKGSRMNPAIQRSDAGGKMPLCQLFFHLVWTTKNRLPLISDDVECTLFSAIRRKASGLRVQLFALHGWTDHLHLVASLPAELSVAKTIGAMKGYSSFCINHCGLAGSFYWQEEYGAFSLDRASLPLCIRYIENQKEHHTQKTGLIREWELVGQPKYSPATPGFTSQPGGSPPGG